MREFHLLLHGDEIRRAELLSNIVVFVPFGFFLSEFLSSTKTQSILKRFENVTFAAFGLSLCIEALQLLLQVGYFEMTDLIMNTVGAFIGAGVSILIRTAFGKARRHENL